MCSKTEEAHPKHVTKTVPPSSSHPQSHPHSKSLASRTPSGSPQMTQRQMAGAGAAVVPVGGGGGATGVTTASHIALEDFDEEDIARYESRKTEEDIAKCRRTQEKIRALREKQDQLKQELEAAKSRLMIDKSRWSFECKTLICCVLPQPLVLPLLLPPFASLICLKTHDHY